MARVAWRRIVCGDTIMDTTPGAIRGFWPKASMLLPQGAPHAMEMRNKARDDTSTDPAIPPPFVPAAADARPS